MSKVSKKAKNSKIKDIKQIVIEQELKPIDEHGYPIPRSKICFRCEESFLLTFVPLKQHYAQRNFWFYWTEKEEDKQSFTCSPCLRKIFLEDKRFYLENIQNIRKRRMLSSYTCSNSI